MVLGERRAVGVGSRNKEMRIKSKEIGDRKKEEIQYSRKSEIWMNIYSSKESTSWVINRGFCQFCFSYSFFFRSTYKITYFFMAASYILILIFLFSPFSHCPSYPPIFNIPFSTLPSLFSPLKHRSPFHQMISLLLAFWEFHTAISVVVAVVHTSIFSEASTWPPQLLTGRWFCSLQQQKTWILLSKEGKWKRFNRCENDVGVCVCVCY